MTVSEWADRLGALGPQTTHIFAAETVVAEMDGSTLPVTLVCDDETIYVVKGPRAGRSLVGDRVVSLLGQRIGAPVARVELIRVEEELIAMDRMLGHFQPGVWHGSAFIPRCTDAMPMTYITEPENRARFAALCVLHTWLNGRDFQFIYDKATPHLVHSVDHGEFLEDGSAWTSTALEAAAEPLTLAPGFDDCGLLPEEFGAARKALEAVSPQHIEEAIGSTPTRWGVTLQELAALAEYVERRRISTLGLLVQTR